MLEGKFVLYIGDGARPDRFDQNSEMLMAPIGLLIPIGAFILVKNLISLLKGGLFMDAYLGIDIGSGGCGWCRYYKK